MPTSTHTSSKVLTFNELTPNMTLKVKGVHCQLAACKPGCLKRLQEMGLTEGAEFTVIKVAPFGDPIEIDLRGYRLCLRKCEACGFELELLTE